MARKSNDPDFVSNPVLFKEMIICLEHKKLTQPAEEMLRKMIRKITTRALRYDDPMDREDAQQEAFHDVWKYWKGFNPAKSDNAFSYFTRIILNGAAKSWKRMHRVKKTHIVRIDQVWNLNTN